jgi:hypothetical protein
MIKYINKILEGPCPMLMPLQSPFLKPEGSEFEPRYFLWRELNLNTFENAL